MVTECRHALNKIGLVVDKRMNVLGKKEVEIYFVNWTQGKSGAKHLRSDLKFVSKVK
jgi:hypothetical protein